MDRGIIGHFDTNAVSTANKGNKVNLFLGTSALQVVERCESPCRIWILGLEQIVVEAGHRKEPSGCIFMVVWHFQQEKRGISFALPGKRIPCSTSNFLAFLSGCRCEQNNTRIELDTHWMHLFRKSRLSYPESHIILVRILREVMKKQYSGRVPKKNT